MLPLSRPGVYYPNGGWPRGFALARLPPEPVSFRDSVSLELARKQGVKSPILDLGPDGAFACDLRNNAAADAFLKANNLETGQFLCCIPRLRFTPY